MYGNINKARRVQRNSNMTILVPVISTSQQILTRQIRYLRLSILSPYTDIAAAAVVTVGTAVVAAVADKVVAGDSAQESRQQ
jgi:hypothetical protein